MKSEREDNGSSQPTVAAEEAGSRGSADAPPVHPSPPPGQSPSMLSPRAAAFSVEALLTAQEETEEAKAPPAAKTKNSEDAAADEVSEVKMEPQSAAEGAATPNQLQDGATRSVNSPTDDAGSGRDSTPHTSDENTDDEVDVEDCSTPVPHPCASPAPERCRTPLRGPSGSPVCVLPSQRYPTEPFSPAPPPGATEWQMLTQMNLRWAEQEGPENRCEGVGIQLLQRDLWTKFHSLTTEMIITKNGRRMFPVVKVRLRGLDPEKTYAVFLDMAAVDTRRYRYVYPSSRWMVAGTGEPLGEQTPYIHPDSPATGVQWMATPAIAFDRLKLTNNRTREAQGQIVLHSMQKYVPRVWVQEVRAGATWAELPRLLNTSVAFCTSFPETSFITVTAYQNQQITRLKIESNPFAKGFRDTSKQKEMERCSVTTVRGRESSATPPSPVVLPLGLSPPQQFHFGAPFPGIPRQFTLPGPLSPPVSPLLLPPTHWLGTLKAGEPPWLQSPTSPLLQSPPPSSLPFLLPSFFPALHTQLPRALDLSKPKDDT
ncbi:T-box transcription factor TBX10-like isoform X1 [Eriocheir sinensis]|uniref:T-box transcription factor TBX10-like isoform X1 n=2 Tax=Eriocheir sinensis TaxID=95602 RepID=UPI0021C5D064|nr:T-box transcription factor TBX10-like isoform X1 [Eriocheir sinensis]